MGVDIQSWLSAAFKGGGGKTAGRAAVMDATAIAAASADWAGWQRRAWQRLGWDSKWDSVDVDEAALGRAAWFALVVCAALVLSHLAAVAFIAFHDLTGRWDAYSLKVQRSTWRTYAQHARSFFVDVAFLLFPALWAFGYGYDAPLFEPLLLHATPARNALRLLALGLAAVLNNVVNRLWAMGVHWAMHESKALYRAVHKRHHCRIRDLCALSAWQDTVVEFVLMEVLGVFLFAQLFNPLPWHFHVLLAAYNGVGGAIDHSAFYIPGTIIDGRYHWDHHVRLDYNYSELEFLDRLFGTLYEHHQDDGTKTTKAKAGGIVVDDDAVPTGEPGLRPPRDDDDGGSGSGSDTCSSGSSSGDEEGMTQAPPEVGGGPEAEAAGGIRPAGGGSEDASDRLLPARVEKAAQSPPRAAADGPRAGEAGGTGAGAAAAAARETRKAQPYS